MSASLVGSEMCIRDRDELCSLVGQNELGKELRRCLLKALAAALLAEPVSYTHLTLPTICSV
eukprot:15068947-Alexandrium_andersonii.AAC.1